MHILNKVRWRAEKYLIDPLVNAYLRNRLYERAEKKKNFCFVTSPSLSHIKANHVFQSIITNIDPSMLKQEDFNIAYDRGISNDPINIGKKEFLRFRFYINAVFAKLALKGGGDFACIGVSWGIVPRMIFEMLKKDELWTNDKKYYLIDKWEKVLFASDKKIKIQENYCGDFDFIQKEFKEKEFKIIKEYAPKAFNYIDTKISYLHLNTGDKNSERQSVEVMYDRITSPGFIIIDNYVYSEDNNSIDTYLKKRNNIVIPMGNSQGIVIKL